jgi:hypothetical protein
MSPATNQKNQQANVNVQNYIMLDGQNLSASNFKNAQSNAHLDNSGGVYQAVTSYSIPGQ